MVEKEMFGGSSCVGSYIGSIGVVLAEEGDVVEEQEDEGEFADGHCEADQNHGVVLGLEVRSLKNFC